MVANATGSSYQFKADLATDQNAEFYVTAKTPVGGLSITSSVARITVLQSVFEPGFVMAEYFPGATRVTIQAGDAGTPMYTYATPAWEHCVPSNEDGTDYGFRFSGFFVPPTTGAYDFFVNSDDSSDLYLSTNNAPEGKRLIAQETGWSNPLIWDATGDGSGAVSPQKRSDQWIPTGGDTAPYASGISLTAGTKYYIEALLL